MPEELKVPGNIIFIRIPDAMARPIGDFYVDPTIPLPVELGRDASGAEDLKNLSWEMLVAGMLRVLAYNPDHEHAAYYRQFIVSIKPDIFNELSAAGVMNARNKDFEVAEEVFKALCGLQPESAWPFINLAVLHEDQADELEKAGKDELADAVREKAFAVYRNLLAMDQLHPDACFNAAFFFLKQKNYERAADLFVSYQSIGDDERKLAKAREIAEKLQDRRHRDTVFKEAFDLIRLNREEEGLQKALNFLADDPDVWNGWFLAGWAQRRLGRYEEGRQSFLKALDLGGQQVDLYNELAICEMELGLYAASRGHLEQALRRESDNIKILSNLGMVALHQQRLQEAAGFFRIVLDLEPEDKLAKQQLAALDAQGIE
ncbi:MAG: tetratricopeptide repeat protein [Spirochaetes bacterium]|nr:tetratricopeptide repeat protein [Spirochaetota bacterium]